MRIPRVLALVGGLLVVGGVVAWLAFPVTDVGWFAYAPLVPEMELASSATTSVFLPSGNVVVLGTARLVGLAAAAVGGLLLAVAGGWWAGARARG